MNFNHNEVFPLISDPLKVRVIMELLTDWFSSRGDALFSVSELKNLGLILRNGCDISGSIDLQSVSNQLVDELRSNLSTYKLQTLGDLLAVLRGMITCIGWEKSSYSYANGVIESIFELVLLRIGALSCQVPGWFNPDSFGSPILSPFVISWRHHSPENTKSKEVVNTFLSNSNDNAMMKMSKGEGEIEALRPLPTTLDIIRVLSTQTLEKWFIEDPASRVYEAGSILSRLREEQSMFSNNTIDSPARRRISWTDPIPNTTPEIPNITPESPHAEYNP